MATRIHVNGNQRFGFINHEITAALQMHFTTESLFHLRFHAIVVKNRQMALVQLNHTARTTRNASCHFTNAIKGFSIINNDAINVFRQPIAHHAFHQIGFGIDASRRVKRLNIALQLSPNIEDITQIATESTLIRTRTHRAHNDAHARRQRQTIQNLLETQPFLRICNLARHPARRLCRRHHHQIATRQRQVCGYTRTLRANRPLGHLHHNFTSRRETLRDFIIRNTLTLRGAIIFILIQTALFIGNHIPIVQKGILLEANIHKRCLQIVFQILDTPLENAPHKALFHRVFHLKLLNATVFNHGHARFKFFDINNDFASFTLSFKKPSKHVRPASKKVICGDCMRAPTMNRNTLQKAHRHHHHKHKCPALTNERQWQSRNGNNPHCHTYINKNMTK